MERMKRRGKKGVEDGDAGVGTEESSGLVPTEPCWSARERRGQMRDDDDRYSVSSYN